LQNVVSAVGPGVKDMSKFEKGKQEIIGTKRGR
jgi:hypothetical protein